MRRTFKICKKLLLKAYDVDRGLVARQCGSSTVRLFHPEHMALIQSSVYLCCLATEMFLKSLKDVWNLNSQYELCTFIPVAERG